MNAAAIVDAILKVKVLENHRRQVGGLLLGLAAVAYGLPTVAGVNVPLLTDHAGVVTAVGSYLATVGYLLRNDPTKKAA